MDNRTDLFQTIEHESGELGKARSRTFQHGEKLVTSGSYPTGLLFLRYGQVELQGVAGRPETIRRDDDYEPIPILAAHAYFHANCAAFEATAVGTVETAFFDTPMLQRLGRNRHVVDIIRDLTRASDMGPELRRRFVEVFARTGILGYDPGTPHLLLLHEFAAYRTVYRMIAMQLYSELTKRRFDGNPRASTKMAPLERPLP